MNNLEERKRIAVSKADGYIGVFATGDCVESKFFQVVNANPKVKWIFHMFCHLYFESSHSGTPYMQLGFECVDSGNSKIPFQYRSIKVIDIHEEAYFTQGIYGYFFYFTVEILDKENVSRVIRIDKGPFQECFSQIIMICKELSTCRIWKMYDMLQENKQLRRKVKELEKEIKLLTKVNR